MSNPMERDELPSSILVETTNRCILKCPVCATPWSMTRPKGDFPYAQFRKLLDQIGWKLEDCDFGWSGEPFLNPDLLQMVALCARRGIFTHIATNGMFLEKYAAEIISSGLHSINVGLDGVNQKMLETYRVGADFGRIVRGVDKLIREKRTIESDRPHVTLQMLIMKHTEEAIDEFIELAEELKVDDVLLKSFNIEEGFWLSQAEKQRMADKFIPNNERFRRMRCQQGCYSINEQVSAAKCTEVITTPVILWDGGVAVCCVDFEARVTFGNINTTSFKDIWLSEPYREYRRRAFRREPAFCARCLYPGSEVFNLRLNLTG
jgi:radical SAM protein with 4Fe4S-binding SPASM domain